MRAVTKYSDFSPMKRAFVENYLCTGDAIESYFSAGYKADCDHSDPKERDRAYHAAMKILSHPLVRQFVEMNKPVYIHREGEIDEKDITDRLNLIMSGNIEQQVLIKGQMYYVKPSFRDQIEAGKVLVQILQKREKDTSRKASKALTGKVQSLIGSARADVVDEQ